MGKTYNIRPTIIMEASMSNIFIGLILALFNLNIDIGSTRIGLLPSFIGYYLILKGLIEMQDVSEEFKKLIPLAWIAIIYSLALYITDLFGVFADIEQITFLLSIISIAFSLTISYGIVSGVRETGQRNQVLLDGRRLMTSWNSVMIVSILSIFSAFMPLLVIMVIIADLVAKTIFIIRFRGSKDLYYKFVYSIPDNDDDTAI